eukprot:9029887-Ditylum_brightwellii.AAC.1
MPVGIFYLASDSTCGLAIHMGNAVMSVLMTQVQPSTGEIPLFSFSLGRRQTSPKQLGLCLPPPIPIYTLEKKEELSPSDYQVYKLWTNLKDKKLAMYLLMVKYYKLIKGQDIQNLEAVYTLAKNFLQGDALQVFQNKDRNQKERDSPAFTKCL